MTPMHSTAPDPMLALERYSTLAAGYDASCRFSRRIRRRAVEALALRGGETVFDVGCGTGALLSDLASRVGRRGRVVGIEQCPEMAALACQRIEELGLSNIELLVGTAQRMRPGRRADALLFCFTHDILQSHEALANLFAHARRGARVVLAGSKLASGWWGAPLNAWKRRHLDPYLTTSEGLERPWEPVQRYCPDLTLLRRCHFGTAYIAAGSYAAKFNADQASIRAGSNIRP